MKFHHFLLDVVEGEVLVGVDVVFSEPVVVEFVSKGNDKVRNLYFTR